MEISNFLITRGSAPVLRLTLQKQESTSGWTGKFRLWDKAGGTMLFQYDAMPATVPNAVALGIFDVVLTANDTNAWAVRTYHWTFERTNVGFEDVLGKGELYVEA
jgi:hypothetical protein